MKILLILAVLVALMAASPTWAHPGRTDAKGGHTCHTNCAKWGLNQEEYHYHNASGGYTNSQGQTFNKSGNLVSASSTSSSSTTTTKATPTPTPASVQATQQPVVKTQPATTPAPSPTPEGEVLGTSEGATPIPEESPESSPTPTLSPSQIPTHHPGATPTPEAKSSGGDSAAALGTLTVLGVGGYYLVRRFRKQV